MTIFDSLLWTTVIKYFYGVFKLKKYSLYNSVTSQFRSLCVVI